MKKKLNSYILNLAPVDFINIVFVLFLTVLSLIFYQRVHNWYIIVTLNILAIVVIFFLAYAAENSELNRWKHLHYWYLVPGIFLIFKELYFLVKPIRIVDYDHLLIKADRFIFGTDPTVWLHQYSVPFVTELLQISYATFFFLPLILAIDLLIQDRIEAMDFAAFTVVLGFILSYIGYLIVPAVGPRFTLHSFEATNTDIPGLFVTNFLREVVNSGESIPAGTVNPLELVQRDVFPSGHTQMTLIVMFLSFKLESKAKWFFLVNGTLLVISTVYLRYHYAIDVIGGAAFMIITLLLSKPLYNWWMKIKNKETFEYGKF